MRWRCRASTSSAADDVGPLNTADCTGRESALTFDGIFVLHAASLRLGAVPGRSSERAPSPTTKTSTNISTHALLKLSVCEPRSLSSPAPLRPLVTCSAHSWARRSNISRIIHSESAQATQQRTKPSEPCRKHCGSAPTRCAALLAPPHRIPASA